MNSYELKKNWQKSDFHSIVAKKMDIINENEFRFQHIYVTSLFSNRLGLHIQFQLEKIKHFISVTDLDMFEEICNQYFGETFCDIRVFNQDNYLHISLVNEGNVIYEVKCISASIGPVHGFDVLNIDNYFGKKFITIKNCAFDDLTKSLEAKGIYLTKENSLYCTNDHGVYFCFVNDEESPHIILLINEINVGCFSPLREGWDFYPYIHNIGPIKSIIGNKQRLSNEKCPDFIYNIYIKISNFLKSNYNN